MRFECWFCIADEKKGFVLNHLCNVNRPAFPMPYRVLLGSVVLGKIGCPALLGSNPGILQVY